MVQSLPVLAEVHILRRRSGRGQSAPSDSSPSGLLFCALTFRWLALYAGAVARAGDVLRRPRIRRAIEGVTGAALLALGLRIAGEHR